MIHDKIFSRPAHETAAVKNWLSMPNMLWGTAWFVLLALATRTWGQVSSLAVTEKGENSQWPVVYQTDFRHHHEDWKFLDDGWEFRSAENQNWLSLHRKPSDYSPPFRSPLHIALLDHKQVSNFQLDVRALSTHEDYPHRDVVIVFGYQSPSQFYYVHLGKLGDEHCNQIFIVNKSDRRKISLTTSQGTDWDDQWHTVRIERNTDSGQIDVYFDNLQAPVMTAKDKTFLNGQIGLGSFDDTADFSSVTLRGESVDE